MDESMRELLDELVESPAAILVVDEATIVKIARLALVGLDTEHFDVAAKELVRLAQEGAQTIARLLERVRMLESDRGWYEAKLDRLEAQRDARPDISPDDAVHLVYRLELEMLDSDEPTPPWLLRCRDAMWEHSRSAKVPPL